MRSILLTLSVSMGLTGAALAAPVAPVRTAADLASQTSRKVCTAHAGLLSHAAYRPAETNSTLRCGQLLSTDTMLTVRHWDHT